MRREPFDLAYRPLYHRLQVNDESFVYRVVCGPESVQSGRASSVKDPEHGEVFEFHNLEGAFGRRATIEQAKGILMAIHGINEREAFEILRNHSQKDGHKLVDVAEALTQTHRLVTPKPPAAPKAMKSE